MKRPTPSSSLVVVVFTGLLTASEPDARASAPFTCEVAEEVYEELVGQVSDQPLHLRICTSAEGAGQRTLILSHWTAPEGEAQDLWQTLFDGTARPVAGAYTVSLDGPKLTLFYPSGTADDPEGQVTTDTWTWSDDTRRFEDRRSVTTSPWAERLALFDAAVSKGDAEAADAALRALGATPNGGRTWLDDELYTRFLGVVRDEALRRHRLLDAEGAAALTRRALTDPPISSPEERPREGQLVLCRDLAPTCSGRGSFNDLPADAEHANLLAALSFFLARGPQPTDALALLDQLLDHFPDTGALHQVRGDALWQAGREEDARVAWRRAVELGVQLPRKTRRRLGD